MAPFLFVVCLFASIVFATVPPQLSPDFTANITASHVNPYKLFGQQFLVWSTSQNRAYIHANGPGYVQELFQLVRNDLGYTLTWSTGGGGCVNSTYINNPMKIADSYFSIPRNATKVGEETWEFPGAFAKVTEKVDLIHNFPIWRNLTAPGPETFSDAVDAYSPKAVDNYWTPPSYIHSGSCRQSVVEDPATILFYLK